jgi:hypothetical protein
LKVLGSFLSLCDEFIATINNLGFPYMLMWLKINNRIIFNYLYSGLLMGPPSNNLKCISMDAMVIFVIWF